MTIWKAWVNKFPLHETKQSQKGHFSYLGQDCPKYKKPLIISQKALNNIYQNWSPSSCLTTAIAHTLSRKLLCKNSSRKIFRSVSWNLHPASNVLRLALKVAWHSRKQAELGVCLEGTIHNFQCTHALGVWLQANC